MFRSQPRPEGVLLMQMADINEDEDVSIACGMWNVTCGMWNVTDLTTVKSLFTTGAATRTIEEKENRAKETERTQREREQDGEDIVDNLY